MIILDNIMDRTVPRVCLQHSHPRPAVVAHQEALYKTSSLTALPERRSTSYGVVPENTNTKRFINQNSEIEVTN